MQSRVATKLVACRHVVTIAIV